MILDILGMIQRGRTMSDKRYLVIESCRECGRIDSCGACLAATWDPRPPLLIPQECPLDKWTDIEWLIEAARDIMYQWETGVETDLHLDVTRLREALVSFGDNNIDK